MKIDNTGRTSLAMIILSLSYNRATLRQQQNSREWGEEVRKILANGMNRPRSGKDAGDHPPITPMKQASREELDGDSWRVYDYITRHFIATVNRMLISRLERSID